MILLSDVLGISALVDAINNPTAPRATESSVLGPFHNEAHEFANGESIASAGAIGEPMLIRGTVCDTTGGPLAGALVDVWETNGNGFYDMQDPDKDEPDCRGIFHTDDRGRFALVGVRAVDYPIPHDGPVGTLLRLLNRTNVRPAHVVSFLFPLFYLFLPARILAVWGARFMTDDARYIQHFVLQHPECVRLTTALYSHDSANVARDPVFGVKKSLIKQFTWSTDAAVADEFGIDMFERGDGGAKGFWMLEHDFVLVRK